MRLKEDASATTPSALFSERDLFSYGAATPPHEEGNLPVLRLVGFIWTHRESGNIIQLIVSTRVEGSLCDIDLTVFFRS